MSCDVLLLLGEDKTQKRGRARAGSAMNANKSLELSRQETMNVKRRDKPMRSSIVGLSKLPWAVICDSFADLIGLLEIRTQQLVRVEEQAVEILWGVVLGSSVVSAVQKKDPTQAKGS